MCSERVKLNTLKEWTKMMTPSVDVGIGTVLTYETSIGRIEMYLIVSIDEEHHMYNVLCHDSFSYNLSKYWVKTYLKPVNEHHRALSGDA